MNKVSFTKNGRKGVKMRSFASRHSMVLPRTQTWQLIFVGEHLNIFVEVLTDRN